MSPRARPASWITATAATLLLVALGAGWTFAWRSLARSEAAWRQLAEEERTLPGRSDGRNDEQELARRHAAAEERIALGRRLLRAPVDNPPPPADVAGLFAGLAALWDECRGRAAWSDIPFPRGDALAGLVAGTEVPDLQAIPRTWVAAGAFAHVLVELLEAGPAAVTAVETVAPPIPNDGATGARVRLGGMAGLEGRSFRVEFSGSTAVLRSFLERLAVSNWPVWVRGVERISDFPPMDARAVERDRPRFRVMVESLAWHEPVVVAAR